MAASPSPPPPPRSSRFRFKSTAQAPDSSGPAEKSQSNHSASSRHHHRRRRRHHREDHRHHHSEKGRSRSRSRSPRPTTPPLSPDAAFRESLFDALADDEGAAYWESVYGQPIHTYSRYKTSAHDFSSSSPNTGAADGAGSSTPVLEHMTDDEYAAYVRARMWEKSHAYLAEERARKMAARERARVERQEEETARQERREQRWRQKGQGGDGAKERSAWEGSLEDAIRRREGRTDGSKEAWKQRWKDYMRAWEILMESGRGPPRAREAEQQGRQDQTRESQTEPSSGFHRQDKRPPIPWPTAHHRLKDISREAVSDFFQRGVESAAAATNSTTTPTDAPDISSRQRLLAQLKVERVRWHPDKMQQRLGGGSGGGGVGSGEGGRGLSEKELKGVTAVFQIVDGLWSKLQESGPG